MNKITTNAKNMLFYFLFILDIEVPPTIIYLFIINKFYQSKYMIISKYVSMAG